MKNTNLFETLNPPAGGWTRLQARLEAEESKQKFELRLWAGISAAMIGALIWTTAFNEVPLPAPPSAKLAVENAEVVERDGTPAGIHYYWVFNTSDQGR